MARIQSFNGTDSFLGDLCQCYLSFINVIENDPASNRFVEAITVV